MNNIKSEHIKLLHKAGLTDDDINKLLEIKEWNHKGVKRND